MSNHSVKAHEMTIPLLGWPTETVSIAWTNATTPHTIVLFVPGNPGLMKWYIRMLVSLVERLGPGYVAHGVSHAGHATDADLISPVDSIRDSSTAWTMEGQIEHKMAYVDHVLKQYKDSDDSSQPSSTVNLIFISHSIGSYFTQQLCLLRPDILQRTRLFIHLMPFICMQAPWSTQRLFDAASAYPKTTITIHKLGMQLLARLPVSLVDRLMQHTVHDVEGRKIAVELVRQPAFAHNFFELGSREIKGVPRATETSALRYLGAHGTLSILFTDDDHWATLPSMKNIQTLKKDSILPSNIHVHYQPRLHHAFVSFSNETEAVVNFCVDQIQSHNTPRSQL